MKDLQDDMLQRYGHQIMVIGEEAQQHIMNATLTLIGVGGLGATALAFLAGAGFKHIYLYDHDKVALSNLHRQIIYGTNDIGCDKSTTAAKFIKLRNSNVEITTYCKPLDEISAKSMEHSDIIIDGSDNIETRYISNDIAITRKVPFLTAGIAGWEGQYFRILPQLGCYRCIFPQKPSMENVSRCETVGIVGPIAGIFGSMLALDAVALISKQINTPVFSMFDGRKQAWSNMAFNINPSCKCNSNM